jgi:hypothetical protein
MKQSDTVMRARPLAPGEIEKLSKEQILEAISRSDGDTFIIHYGEICLVHSGLAEMLAVRDRKLLDWEKIDPAVVRAAEAASSKAEEAWRVENERLQAESERIAALIEANNERQRQALEAIQKPYREAGLGGAA